MKLYNILFVLCFFSVAYNSYAIQNPYMGNCRFYGNMEFFEDCLDKELNPYDNELNNLYKIFSKRARHKKLKKIELLWIKFKEADCDYIAREVNEGREYQAVYKACLINKTKVRIEDFKRPVFYSEWFKKMIKPQCKAWIDRQS